MKRVFAILHEPASYTLDRNRAVYDKLGVEYCYINGSSLAKSIDTGVIDTLNGLPIFKLINRLRAILSANDIVIMNGYTGRIFRWLYLINIFYGRIIGIDSDTQLNIPGNKLKRRVKQIYLSAIFRNKHIYGLSGGSKTHKQLFRHYGMDESQIFLMPMMVDNKRFRVESPRQTKPFTFLYVGRIIAVKNLDLLLEAFTSRFPSNDVCLKLVGTGDMAKQLKKKYDRYHNVIFTGAKYGDDLIREYAEASAFVLPSSYEPWGLVVNEAMAAGLPVIVSNQVGAAWDLVEGCDTGFIFRFDDKNDLADKMEQLVNDNVLYRRFSQNATDKMHRHWNYDLYTKCLIEFINTAR